MNDTNRKKEIIYITIIFAAIFILSAGIFSITGLAPDGLKASDIIDVNGAQEGSVGFNLNKTFDDDIQGTYTRPDRVTIEKIGVDSIIQKPNTRNVSELDKLLSLGAVHYPGSGSVESGNMFLFGHSTGFQVVQNQAYKTFNNLDKLDVGDSISVFADGEEYVYIVTNVSLVSEDSARIDFDDSTRMLTISTCNSFGAVQDRWVVEAEFSRIR